MIYIENKNEVTEIKFPKTLDNGANAAYLQLVNSLGNFNINVEDTSTYSNYYFFSVSLSDVNDGEYYAYLKDAEQNVLSQTIMLIGNVNVEVDHEFCEDVTTDKEFDPNLVLPYVTLHLMDGTVQTDFFETTVIPKYKYSGRTDIVSVEISDGVTEIGLDAFKNCSNLTGTVEIPDSVTRIGGFAFAYCSGLTELVFGQNSSCTNIQGFAFLYCTSLQHIYLPSQVQMIVRKAFGECTNLSSITSYVFTINYENPVPVLYAGCFDNVAETGELHYPIGADNTRLSDTLPSGWTSIADVVIEEGETLD